MKTEDWERSIDQLAGLGTRMVQFIGGEPTLHRALPGLIRHALDRGLAVEVFTNLVHVRPELWEVFSRSGVQLATSYYSDDVEQHERITRGRRSYERTRSNIVEAVRRSIPVRVGVAVRVLPVVAGGQRARGVARRHPDGTEDDGDRSSARDGVRPATVQSVCAQHV